MKIRMISGLFLVVSFTAGASAGVSFTVRDAGGFMKDVARSCLSTPESRIEMVRDDQLLVTDASEDCALEIRQFADGWEGSPRFRKTVAVFASGDQKASLAKKLVDKFGKGFLIHSSMACPCLLLRGPRAEEAAAFARR